MRCPDDQVLIAMAGGSLPPAQYQAIAGHVDHCSHCQQIIETALGEVPTALGTLPQARPSDDVATDELIGVTIDGRYIVKELVGRGGMGSVYLARDRTLGRDVAIKVHRAGSGGDRLHQEAVAMAKLAHPNVVTVFEVAAYADRLYVVMEYVRGGTLRSWLAAEPRSWRDTLELLLQAGQGLQAAHAAGLVHRDFKPENILVGEDGRPRVSDFGLARSDEIKPGDDIVRTDGSLVDSPMTQTGALMGTPSYMAPEQLASGVVDARSDLFAFCVVCWECLYGKRPFEGATVASLAVAIDRQEISAPPPASSTTTSDMAPRIRELLRQGLVADPAKRPPDLQTLLGALRGTISTQRNRRGLWIVAGAVAAAAVPLAIVVATRSNEAAAPASSACVVPADAFADVWDPPLQTKLRTAFVGARPKDGEQVYMRVAAVLDEYRDSWLAMRRETCEATTRGEQSAALLDLRMTCLDHAREELRAVTQGLAAADDKQVVGSARAVLGLTALSRCADKASLSAPVRPPEEKLRAQVEAARSELATARALRLLGRIEPALEKSQAVATRAAELGYRPLEAEALLVLGDLKDRSGDSAAAIALLEKAVIAADAGNHRLVAAEAWSNLSWILGYGEREFAKAEWAVKMANARIESLGGHPELAAQLANYEGLIFETKGELTKAKPRYEAALAMHEKLGERESWKIALVLNDLGGVERKLRNFEASKRHHERALAIRKRVFGDNHPYVFSSLLNLGTLAWSQDDFVEAEKLFVASLAVADNVFPPKHPQRALALSNLASAYERQDKWTESVAMYRQALAISEAVRGPEHPDVAETLRQLGNVLESLEQYDEARTSYERALKILDKKPEKAEPGEPPDTKETADPELVSLLTDYGDVLTRRKQDYAAAEKVLTRAIALHELAQPDDPEMGLALTSLGALYVKTGRVDKGKATLERAMKLRTDESIPKDELAETELVLADALWLSRSERARAIELARSAKVHVEEAKATQRKVHRDVEKWLAAHPAP